MSIRAHNETTCFIQERVYSVFVVAMRLVLRSMAIFCCCTAILWQQCQGHREDEECKACRAIEPRDLVALEEAGKSVVCDMELCVHGHEGEEGLHCNALGLGQACRFCGACIGCNPCPANSAAIPTSTPMSGTSTDSTGLSEADDSGECARCRENLNNADAAALASLEQGVMCDPSCLVGDTSNCNIFGLGQMCRLCGACEGCKACTEDSDFGATGTPTPQPLTTLEPKTLSPSGEILATTATTAAPSIAVTETPVYLWPSEVGSGEIGGCPVEPPEAEFCSDSQETIECRYHCVCCNAETEFDENCQPTDPFVEDKCVFTSFFWCDKGKWVMAVADPYCPSWYSSSP